MVLEEIVVANYEKTKFLRTFQSNFLMPNFFHFNQLLFEIIAHFLPFLNLQNYQREDLNSELKFKAQTDFKRASKNCKDQARNDWLESIILCRQNSFGCCKVISLRK